MESLPGTLEPEGFSTIPTTRGLRVAEGEFTRYSKTGGFLEHTHNELRVIKLKESLRGAVSSPYGVYGWPLEPEGLTSAPTTMNINHPSNWQF